MSAKPGPSRFSPVISIPVFAPAVIVAILLVIGTISNPELAGKLFADMLAFVTLQFGWFYMLAVASFLMFLVVIAFSRWGHIKLGPDHSDPQYSFPVWFAMLFAAGYGIALLFFGVAEPVLHYASPPEGAPQTVNAASQAMQIAFFHWGFHIWAIYGIVGLVLAYFSFRHGLPLSMRSALYPIIGDRIYGPIGHVIDVFAILGTLFGVSTTLGLSVTQINAGLNYLWPEIPMSVQVQVGATVVITAMTAASVVAGLDKGIKRLSILNMVLAISLMVFIFVAGPTRFILETFLQNTGSYLSNIVERTFNLQAYSRSDWIGNWTLFIFGWTIAWAPFVGLFIARISRGRTIRQFVLGVMLVPTIFTFMWFSIFGDTALHLIMMEGYTTLITDVQDNHAIALFKLYEHFPFTRVVSVATVFLIMVFFVTSADSGALVADALASGGATVTPAWQRFFWAALLGVVASTLLVAGGLQALQAMTIVSALPFAIIMMIGMVGLWRALVIEGYREDSLQASSQPTRKFGQGPGAWQRRLSGLITYPSLVQVENFIKGACYDALVQVRQELMKKQWPAEVVLENDPVLRTYITIADEESLDFIYEVRLVGYPRPDFIPGTDSSEGGEYYRAEVFLRRGGQSYDIYGFDRQELINDVLDQLEKYFHFRHLSPESLPWNVAAHDEMLNPVAEVENKPDPAADSDDKK